MLLIIDNYDSFTYNLYQAFAVMTKEIEVIRNDVITSEEVKALAPEAIVISPGPGKPEKAGNCLDIIQACALNTPILGVCLGHQAIATAFGGKVIAAPELVHGKTCSVFHRRQGLFSNVSLPFTAGRYHSLSVERESLPSDLVVEADTLDGTIMGIRHLHYPCYGVQFHPESILTPEGSKILQSFLSLVENFSCPKMEESCLKTI